MASLHVRNLDPTLVEKLKSRAAHNGRSVEAEHRAILREVLQTPSGGERREAFLALAERARALSVGRPQTPSEVLQRESRDEAR
jgi:plasmid stability protein